MYEVNLAAALAAVAGGTALLLTRTASRGAVVAIGGPLVGVGAIIGLEYLFAPREWGGTEASSLVGGVDLLDLLTLVQIAIFVTPLIALAAQSLVPRRGMAPRGLGHPVGARGILLAGVLLVAFVALTATGTFPVRLKPAEQLLGLATLMVGLTWDVLMSGERLTNGDSPRFPRSGRVLLYLGNLASTVGFIVYMFAVRNEDLMEVYWIILKMPLLGTQIVGLPVVVYLWILRGALVWPATRDQPGVTHRDAAVATPGT